MFVKNRSYKIKQTIQVREKTNKKERKIEKERKEKVIKWRKEERNGIKAIIHKFADKIRK